MKDIFLFSAILFTLASVAIAQTTKDPNLRHLRTERSPKSPNVTVAPRHRPSTPAPHKTPKPASVDAQLDKLERQTTPGTGKSARKTTPSPTTTAPKTSDPSAGSQPSDFKYQAPKG